MADNTRPGARSGTFTLGGDLPVHRLGFGAMRLTGKGIWGAPEDPDEAIRVLPRAIDLGVNFHRHGRFLRTRGERAHYRRSAPSLPRESGHRDQGRAPAPGPISGARTAGRNICARRSKEASDGSGSNGSICFSSTGSTQGPARGPARGAGAAAAGGQDPAYRPVGGQRRRRSRRSAGWPRSSPSRTVQSGQPEERGRARLLRSRRARLHSVVPARDRQTSPSPVAPLARVAERLNAKPSQVALAWLLHRSPVMLPIPGTSRVRHLEENMAAALVELDQETWREPGAPGRLTPRQRGPAAAGPR